MKTHFFKNAICFLFLATFFIHLPGQEVNLSWNTFLGGIYTDYGNRIAVDNSGNIYVAGDTRATWGSPVRPHSGEYDAYVARLDSNGNLIWHTFLGSATIEFCYGIGLDRAGNVYVTGTGSTTWGSPLEPLHGRSDAFVACLNSAGNLVWNTFLGSAAGTECGYGIKTDSSGNVYVTGSSSASWGKPIRRYTRDNDCFVACLDSSGTLVWNTFLGGYSTDYSREISLDGTGYLYVIGQSNASWGTPVRPFSSIGSADVFAARLDINGILVWNTFLGQSSWDRAGNIIAGGTGNIYVSGGSYNGSWGSPVQPHSGQNDAFLACLNNAGNLVWNTFMGSATYDSANGIALDTLGNVYVAGESTSTWGSPLQPYNGNNDAFVACIDSEGNRLWNTFLGSASQDRGNDIAVDRMGHICVTGVSSTSWGSPVRPYTAQEDAFVARLTQSYRVDAGVFRGNGRVSPPSQIIGYGQNAWIDIIPGLGYRIESIRDNGIAMGIEDPYVIRNVRENHTVIVTLSNESFPVTASVSGGHGQVSPGNQTVYFAQNAVIHIYPDSGYRIQSITDNGNSMPIANPYVIANVQESHQVIISFEPDMYPPEIKLTAIRQTERAWIIKREYGKISIQITEHSTNPQPVAKYILYRLNGTVWTPISEYGSAGTYSYIDKFLESGKTVSYKVAALDSVGIVVAESDMVSI